MANNTVWYGRYNVPIDYSKHVNPVPYAGELLTVHSVQVTRLNATLLARHDEVELSIKVYRNQRTILEEAGYTLPTLAIEPVPFEATITAEVVSGAGEQWLQLATCERKPCMAIVVYGTFLHPVQVRIAELKAFCGDNLLSLIQDHTNPISRTKANILHYVGLAESADDYTKARQWLAIADGYMESIDSTENESENAA